MTLTETIRETLKELRQMMDEDGGHAGKTGTAGSGTPAGSAGDRRLPPDRRNVVRVIKGLQALMFPMCFRWEDPEIGEEKLLTDTMNLLCGELTAALRFRRRTPDMVRKRRTHGKRRRRSAGLLCGDCLGSGHC